MREILEKILEVVGNDDVIFIGKNDESGIKNIQPEEIELYPRRYKNIIVEDIEQLDEKTMKKLTGMADCLWILFSIDKVIEKVDSTVENMLEKEDFKNVVLDEKIENLKKLSGGNAFIANFHLPDMALVIPKIREKFLNDLETEPLSSFFLNLSMVEYLKSKLEEVKKEEKKLKVELELERLKVKNEIERFNSIKSLLEEERREKNNLKEEMEELIKRFNSDLKEKEQEVNKIDLERKETEETYNTELKKITLDMGIKLEEKEEELKRLKNYEEKELK